MSCLSTMSRTARKTVAGFSLSVLVSSAIAGVFVSALLVFLPVAMAVAPTRHSLTATIYVEGGLIVGGHGNDNGGVATSSDFTLKVGPYNVSNGSQNVLNVGDYTVGEIENIDDDATISGDCDISNGFSHLELGETKTCTITNNDRVSAGTGRGTDGGDGKANDVNGSRSGHDTNRLGAQALFVVGDDNGGTAEGAFGGGNMSGPFTAEEKEKICTMQKAQYFGGDDLVQWVAELIAGLLQRPDASPILAALKDPVFCASPKAAVVPKKEPLAVRFNKNGVILSSNPVWNRCAAGGYISSGLIKSNTDTSMHRQAAVEVYRPLTCSSYHTNNENVWRHPDFADLFVTLDAKGHLVGKLPSGYVAVQSQNADLAEGSPAAVAGK